MRTSGTARWYRASSCASTSRRRRSSQRGTESRGQVGGGVWTSPTVDPASNTIYVTTGTQTNASQLYAQAFVALNATTLAVKGSWQVPLADQVSDGDWGTTPTLINGGLVAAANKNGVLYALRRTTLSHRTGVAAPDRSRWSMSALRGRLGRLRRLRRDTFVRRRRDHDHRRDRLGGSVTAVTPTTGNVLWRHGTVGPVIPALAYVNGLVLAGAGANFEVLDAATGSETVRLATGDLIFSPPTVSGGRIFIGSQDSNLYAFGIEPPTTPPANTVRNNAGGPAYDDSQGNAWSPDCCSSGGQVFPRSRRLRGRVIRRCIS